MTPQHVFYIPTLFLLGFIFGIIFSERKQAGINNNYSELIKSKQLNRKLLYTFLIFILVFIITHLFEIPFGSKQVSKFLGGQEILDKKPIFTSAEVYAKIGTFPKEGLRVYKLFTFTIDILFPLSLFAFLITYASYVSHQIQASKYIKRLLLYFPFLWLSIDFLENFIIYIILSAYPVRYEFLGNTIGRVTVIKFSLLVCSLIVPTILFIYKKLNLKNRIRA